MILDEYFKSLDKFITVAEAARIWNHSSRHIRRLCESGKIRAHKFNNQWLVIKDQDNNLIL